jgi:hypothetical protein
MQPQAALNASIGVYENISPTGGSGTGLIVDVEIANTGRGNGAIYTIVDGGSGYKVGDTVFIQNTDIGGSPGSVPGLPGSVPITRLLLDGDVSVTKTSTITVTEDEISLNSTAISLSGSISSISAETVIAANASFQIANMQSLAVNGMGGSTVVFTGLPTNDPLQTGKLWVDAANGYILKVSQG